MVSLPRFIVKPPVKVAAVPGYTFTLNCSATGDPQPAIRWKRLGSQLPVGRSQQINGALVIRNIAKSDAGNYMCVATSAGVFDVETVSSVDVNIPKGRLILKEQFHVDRKVLQLKKKKKHFKHLEAINF